MKSIEYVKKVDYRCQNPECKSGYNIEGHHIIPRSKGGVDEYWNIMALCKKCHGKAHKNWESRITTFFYYKCLFELIHFGHFIDDGKSNFKNLNNDIFEIRNKVKKAIRKKQRILTQKQCLNCNKTFKTYREEQKYCSVDCRKKSSKKCKFCGHIFYPKSKSQQYCSKNCRTKFNNLFPILHRIIIKSKLPETVICPNCQIEFRPFPKNKKYCSIHCKDHK